MKAALRRAAVRAPPLLLLAVVLTLAGARSTLGALLPEEFTRAPLPVYLFVLHVAFLSGAAFRQASPLPVAGVVTVLSLVFATYGASRLDWLRLLKDFGVAEDAALDPLRLALALVAVALLWALHTNDLAHRIRTRALDRGIERGQANAAAARVVRRCAEAGGIAVAGVGGLVLLSVAGVLVGGGLPTERLALVAPLGAASLLVAAAVWLAASRRDGRAGDTR